MKKISFIIIIVLLLAHSAFAQFNFFNGRDWKALTNPSMTKEDSSNIKIIFLKSVYEASLFCGRPIIPKNQNIGFTSYIPIIDDFYAQDNNINIPVYFALRIAHMIQEGLDQRTIDQYKAAALLRLNKMGLLNTPGPAEE